MARNFKEIFDEHLEYTTATAYASVLLRYLQSDKDIKYVHDVYKLDGGFFEMLKRNSYMYNASVTSANLLKTYIFERDESSIRIIDGDVDPAKLRQLALLVPKIIRQLMDFGVVVIIEEKGVFKLQLPVDVLVFQTSNAVTVYRRDAKQAFAWEAKGTSKTKYKITKAKLSKGDGFENVKMEGNIYVLKTNEMGAGLTSFDNQLGISDMLNQLTNNVRSLKNPAVMVRGNVRGADQAADISMQDGHVNVATSSTSDLVPLMTADVHQHLLQYLQILQQNISENYRLPLLTSEAWISECTGISHLITNFLSSALDATVLLRNHVNREIAERDVKTRMDLMNVMVQMSTEDNNMFARTDPLEQLQLMAFQLGVDGLFNNINNEEQ